MRKNIVSAVYLKDGKAVTGRKDISPYAGGDAVGLAEHYSNRGADLLLIADLSATDEEHDLSLTVMRQMARRVDIPMWGMGNVRRVEDVKKIIYAGCRKAVLNGSKASNMEMLQEVSQRFGRDRIAMSLDTDACAGLSSEEMENIKSLASALILLAENKEKLDSAEILLKSIDAAEEKAADPKPAQPADTSKAGNGAAKEAFPVILLLEDKTGLTEEERLALYRSECLEGACDMSLRDPAAGLMEIKARLKAEGMDLNMFSSAYSWDDLKKGPDGLIPVVVQDYKNEEVLMVAYMNQEAYEETIRTGVMTYWSRSRSELWVKGLTSGHYQYLKEMRIDCDNDTLLAKVAQIGAACHTGNRSCFYRTAMKKDYADRNPMRIFESVYDVIEDRKLHPKEGSYTNYLFDKGIDKILKKCGEEAAEIIIAAKNPNPEEVKYEIADFLYHVMVLMSERGITWEDVTQELANR